MSRLIIRCVAGVVAFVVAALGFSMSVPSRALAQEAHSAEEGYMFNTGFYFYRNPGGTPLSSVSGDFSYVGTRDPYFPGNSGGAYGRMDVYSTLTFPENSIGRRLSARYNNAGWVMDASRPEWSQACDLEVTFVIRRAVNYSDTLADDVDSMCKYGTSEIGVATDLSRGFRFTGMAYTEMQVRFYYPGTNTVVPIDSMWFSSASLQGGEGFNIDHAISGYVSGEGFNLNPDSDHSGWKGDAYRASDMFRWHAVDGAYVYEYGHANGGTYGFFGVPTLDHVGEVIGVPDYEIIDSMPSDKMFPDGHYAKRTLGWRAGSVLSDMTTTNVLTGAIFSESFERLRPYSAGLDADWSLLGRVFSEVSAAEPTYARFYNPSHVSGAIWFVPNFAPATSVVPPPPVKSVDKAYVASGETVTYTVTQRIGRRGSDMADDMTYDAFKFTDELPLGLDYVVGSMRVWDQFGNEVTGQGSVYVNGRTVMFDFGQGYLDNIMVYNGGTFTFKLSGVVNEATLANRVVDRYDNTAKVTFNNRYDRFSNTVRTIPRYIDVAVKVVSDYPDVLVGNSLYGLSDARFDVVRNGSSGVVHTYVTDVNGDGAVRRYVVPGDYTVTQVRRSAGHNVANPNHQGFSFDGSSTGELTLTYVEPPVLLVPASIAWKLDSDKGSTSVIPRWQGDAGDGSGFKVRVDFYPNLSWSGLPYASAVFKADADGVVSFANATPVDGTTWRYRYGGRNVIPLGSIIVTEVAAPVGYRVNSVPHKATITDVDGVAVLNVS